jgi:predicted dehydrogenase
MGVTWTHCVAASKRWQAAAYVDTDRQALEDAARRHGMPAERCFTDLRTALRDVEADALLDVTPQKFRKAVCCAAFDRGLHVLAEKPLADSLKNAKAIIAHAAKRRRTFMVAQNYRYQAIAQTVKRFIASGRLGTLGYIGISFHKGPHFGGYREQMSYPLVLDMSIHHVDLVRCVTGADIDAVEALSVAAPWNWNQGDATIVANMELTNGVAVCYFGSWVASGAETPWNADWRIEGSKGVLLWENDRLWFSNKPDQRRPVRLIQWPVSHQTFLLEAFARALDGKTEPETSGRRNLNSLATTYAIVRAAQTRRRVVVRGLLA